MLLFRMYQNLYRSSHKYRWEVVASDCLLEAGSAVQAHTYSPTPLKCLDYILAYPFPQTQQDHILNCSYNIQYWAKDRRRRLDPLPTVPKSAKLKEITPLLRHYGAVLIIDYGELAGIITKADLLEF